MNKKHYEFITRVDNNNYYSKTMKHVPTKTFLQQMQ